MRRLLAVLLALAVGGPALAHGAAPAGKQRAVAKLKQQERAARRHAAAKRREMARRHAAAAAQVAGVSDAPAPVLPDPVVAVPTPEPVVPPAPLPRTLSVAAKEFALTPSRTRVGAGSVTVEFRNAGEDPHDLRLDGAAGLLVALWDELLPGDLGRPTTDTRTVTLLPGTYRFVCTLPGHEAAGMATQIDVVAG